MSKAKFNSTAPLGVISAYPEDRPKEDNKIDPASELREESIKLIDLSPLIGKIYKYGGKFHLSITSLGSINLSRYEPARSTTISGIDNLIKLRDILDKYLKSLGY